MLLFQLVFQKMQGVNKQTNKQVFCLFFSDLCAQYFWIFLHLFEHPIMSIHYSVRNGRLKMNVKASTYLTKKNISYLGNNSVEKFKTHEMFLLWTRYFMKYLTSLRYLQLEPLDESKELGGLTGFKNLIYFIMFPFCGQ